MSYVSVTFDGKQPSKDRLSTATLLEIVRDQYVEKTTEPVYGNQGLNHDTQIGTLRGQSVVFTLNGVSHSIHVAGAQIVDSKTDIHPSPPAVTSAAAKPSAASITTNVAPSTKAMTAVADSKSQTANNQKTQYA
jgi:hypothetical protein